MEDTTSQRPSMAKENIEKQVYLFRDGTMEQIQALYDEWAPTYDQDLLIDSNWPCVPTLVKRFIEVVGNADKNLKILDLGAGTGMLALELQKFGFSNIDAIDASESMLQKAKDKQLYKKYMCNIVSAEQLDIKTGEYEALISCGTITGGHVKADAFPEIVRWVKKDGLISFTIRKDVYDDCKYEYKNEFEELVKSGKWEELHREISDYCLTGEEIQRKCYICCYKVLRNER